MNRRTYLGGGSASGTVASTNTQVLFNDAGTIIGDAGFTYNKTTDSLTLVGSVTASSFIASSGAAGEVRLFNAAGTFYVAWKAANPGGNVTWTLPATDALGYFRSNASGTVSLSNPTKTRSINILTPTTGDTNKIQFVSGSTFSITKVACSTDTGTASIIFDKRAVATPNTAGTDLLSAALVCDNNTQSSCASGCDVSTLQNNTAIGADLPINLQITATASTPNVVRIHVTYTLD